MTADPPPDSDITDDGYTPEAAEVGEPEVWEVALQQALDRQTDDSYDLVTVYMEAAEAVIDREPDVGLRKQHLTRLCGHMIETLTDKEPPWRLVGLTVRRFGKAALYCWEKALGRTDVEDPKQWFRYACGVCARLMRGEE